MTTYSHAYDLAFEVESSDETGEDVTPAMLRAALLRRIASLDAANEWLEACGAPFDSYDKDTDEA
jgi:hypothetical protein